MKKYLLALLVLCACTTTGPKVKIVRENLFPSGTYEQKINLILSKTETSPERQFSFHGILKMDKDKILVLALSPFGTTEFKLEDDGKSVKTEIYREAMKKAKDKITDYYVVFKPLLKAKQSKSSEKNLIWEKEDSLGLPVKLRKDENIFSIKRYDQNCVPTFISIASKGFKVDVRVTEYEEN